MSSLKFECDNCGGSEIEVILKDCTVVNRITHFGEDREPVYGSTEVLEGYPNCYVCAHCGSPLSGVTDDESLVEWVAKRA